MIRGGIIAFGVGLLAYATQVTAQLGAHPFWAASVVVWGGILAAGISFSPWPRNRFWRVGGLLALTLVSFALATEGKSAFAASYAEDGFAGQRWYFGWILTCAFALAFVQSLAVRRAT